MIGKRVLLPQPTVKPKGSRSGGQAIKVPSQVIARPNIFLVDEEDRPNPFSKFLASEDKRRKRNSKQRNLKLGSMRAFANTSEYNSMARHERQRAGEVIGNTVGNLLDDVARRNSAIKRDLTVLANSKALSRDEFVKKIMAYLKSVVPDDEPEAVEAAGKPAVPDAKADFLEKARARGMALKLQLFNSDEMFQAIVVAALLGVSTARVSQMVTEKRLFSLRHPVNRTHVRYPAWQLDDGVRDVLPLLLKTLEGLNGWAIRHFFTTADSYLRGLTPLQVLQGKVDNDTDKARLAELLGKKSAVELVKEAAEDYMSGGR